MKDDFDHSKPTKERRAIIRERREQRIQDALASLERDTPIREAFHAYTEKHGYGRRETPPPGFSYNSSMIDALWHCWLTATLKERNEK